MHLVEKNLEDLTILKYLFLINPQFQKYHHLKTKSILSSSPTHATPPILLQANKHTLVRLLMEEVASQELCWNSIAKESEEGSLGLGSVLLRWS